MEKVREDKAEEVIFNMKDEEELAREGKWGRKNISKRGNSMCPELGKSFQGLKNKNSFDQARIKQTKNQIKTVLINRRIKARWQKQTANNPFLTM